MSYHETSYDFSRFLFFNCSLHVSITTNESDKRELFYFLYLCVQMTRTIKTEIPHENAELFSNPLVTFHFFRDKILQNLIALLHV